MIKVEVIKPNEMKHINGCGQCHCWQGNRMAPEEIAFNPSLQQGRRHTLPFSYTTKAECKSACASLGYEFEAFDE